MTERIDPVRPRPDLPPLQPVERPRERDREHERGRPGPRREKPRPRPAPPDDGRPHVDTTA